MNPWLASAIAIPVVVIVLEASINYNVPPCVFPVDALSRAAQLAYEALWTTTYFLISLALLVLGALGVMHRKISVLENGNIRAKCANALYFGGGFTVSSLYFAYGSYVEITNAALNSCDTFSRALQLTLLCQGCTLALGSAATLYLLVLFLSVGGMNNS